MSRDYNDRACWRRYARGDSYWLNDGHSGPTVVGRQDSAYQLNAEELRALWAKDERVWSEELEKAGGDTAVALRACLLRRRRQRSLDRGGESERRTL